MQRFLLKRDFISRRHAHSSIGLASPKMRVVLSDQGGHLVVGSIVCQGSIRPDHLAPCILGAGRCVIGVVCVHFPHDAAERGVVLYSVSAAEVIVRAAYVAWVFRRPRVSDVDIEQTKK